MGKIIIVLAILVIILLGASFGSACIKQVKNTPLEQIQPLGNTGDQKNLTDAQVGIPQTVNIPKIDMDASIEQVGLDPERKMDVPKNSDNVGWYKLGYKPGEKGNAVFAGHFDKADGSPAVFSKLENLTPGDKIYVRDANGKTHIFSVERISRYPYDNFPIKEVFGDFPEPRLNLITCQGAWNAALRNYSHRVVVYSRLDQ